MQIVRWQPRSTIRTAPLADADGVESNLTGLWNWAFGGSDLGNWNRPAVPALDVIEEENRYVVRAEVPGITKDEVEISYQNGVLTLKGERNEAKEGKSGRHYVQERFEGKFARDLRLPEKVDVDKIEANLENGVLELSLPFSPEAQPRKIEIRH